MDNIEDIREELQRLKHRGVFQEVINDFNQAELLNTVVEDLVQLTYRLCLAMKEIEQKQNKS